MSTEIINAIEQALKPALTQKNGLTMVIKKVNQAEPMVANHCGYDHRAARLMNKAQMAYQRAANETDATTRKLAHVIGLLDDGIEREKTVQPDIFDGDQPDMGTSEPPQLNGEVYPEINADRLVLGGDAHDSLSTPQLMGATGDELPVLRGHFIVDGVPYVAVAIGAGQWVEAHEIVFLDEVDEEDLEFETGVSYAGQHALLDDSNDGGPAEVILLDRMRFIVQQPEEDEAEDEPASEDVQDFAGDIEDELAPDDEEADQVSEPAEA